MTSGYMPVLKSVVENENYAAWLAKANGYEQLVATCVKVGIESQNDYFVSDAFKGSSKARDEVGLLMQACFTDYKTATDKMAMIKEKFAAAIEECEY
jgi:hypothetical protein